MVAQRGQTLGQNPAYRPSDIFASVSEAFKTLALEGLSGSQVCERGAGLSGWSFAADDRVHLLLLRTSYLSVMFLLAGRGWSGLGLK